jgi:hypothetical protein
MGSVSFGVEAGEVTVGEVEPIASGLRVSAELPIVVVHS